MNVIVNGVTQPYRYFSGEHDIAFVIAVDAYLLFKKHQHRPSVTPILSQLYNFPPQIRCCLPNLYCLGFIPGPNSVVDYPSFMVPLNEEGAQLAFGISMYNPIKKEFFNLQAYGIQEHSDIIAMAKMMCMKSHNGFCPCRNCKITGVRNLSQSKTTYYVPLQTPRVSHQTRQLFDPHALPLHDKKHFDDVLEQLAMPMPKGKRHDLEVFHGIKQPAAIRHVESMNPAKSNPWEWLHLFCENNVKNQVLLWMGRFKGLDSGSENYEIIMDKWK